MAARAEPVPSEHAADLAAEDSTPLGDEQAVAASPSEVASASAKASPFEDLSDEELENRLLEAPESLGSLSVGLPNNGRLLNGVRPEDGKLFELVSPGFAWGTEETVAYLQAAVSKVHEQFPNTAPVHIGHISGASGGHLSPHLSHQSGRDVDVGYYYAEGQRRWYRRATADNLDVARTWALVRAFVTETDVEMILIDHPIQRVLREHALASGEDPEWVQSLFETLGSRQAIIRHVRGHGTHIHVRFFNPIAQRSGQRLYSLLVAHKLVPPVTVFAQHRVRKGETLGKLARRYGTTVEAIQRANGLRNTLIQARRVYKIPRKGGPRPIQGQLNFPERRLPPL